MPFSYHVVLVHPIKLRAQYFFMPFNVVTKFASRLVNLDNWTYHRFCPREFCSPYVPKGPINFIKFFSFCKLLLLGWFRFKSKRWKFGVLYDGGTMARCCNCEGWVVDKPNIKFNFKFTIGTSGAIMIETKQDKN